jgi:hypothetical protein
MSTIIRDTWYKKGLAKLKRDNDKVGTDVYEEYKRNKAMFGDYEADKRLKEGQRKISIHFTQGLSKLGNALDRREKRRIARMEKKRDEAEEDDDNEDDDDDDDEDQDNACTQGKNECLFD